MRELFYSSLLLVFTACLVACGADPQNSTPRNTNFSGTGTTTGGTTSGLTGDHTVVDPNVFYAVAGVAKTYDVHDISNSGFSFSASDCHGTTGSSNVEWTLLPTSNLPGATLANATTCHPQLTLSSAFSNPADAMMQATITINSSSKVIYQVKIAKMTAPVINTPSTLPDLNHPLIFKLVKSGSPTVTCTNNTLTRFKFSQSSSGNPVFRSDSTGCNPNEVVSNRKFSFSIPSVTAGGDATYTLDCRVIEGTSTVFTGCPLDFTKLPTAADPTAEFQFKGTTSSSAFALQSRFTSNSLDEPIIKIKLKVVNAAGSQEKDIVDLHAEVN